MRPCNFEEERKKEYASVVLCYYWYIIICDLHLAKTSLWTRSDSEPFVEDIFGIIPLFQLLEPWILVKKQGLGSILHDNTVLFLKKILIYSKCERI